MAQDIKGVKKLFSMWSSKKNLEIHYFSKRYSQFTCSEANVCTFIRWNSLNRKYHNLSLKKEFIYILFTLFGILSSYFLSHSRGFERCTLRPPSADLNFESNPLIRPPDKIVLIPRSRPLPAILVSLSPF